MMVHVPDTVKAFVQRVEEAIDPDLVLLFGSRATETGDRDSDYDILVVDESFEDEPSHARATRMYRLHDGSFALDVVCLTPEEFERKKEFTINPATSRAKQCAVTLTGNSHKNTIKHPGTSPPSSRCGV